MDPLSTSLIGKLASLEGAGWLVAAIFLLGVIALYRELQKCQAGRHSDVREIVTTMTTATQAVQAMTLGLDAVKRGQEEMTRLMVENNKGQGELARQFMLSEENGNKHRELVIATMKALTLPEPKTGGRSR